jgi:C4-type Zn-finger protein
MGFLTDFREVVKGLKRKKIGEQKTKLCPRCRSPKISISSGFDTYPRLYGITPGRYVCAECGYSGPLVLEQTKEELG